MGDAPRSVAEVREAVRRDRRLKYLFFWGHRPRRPGAVDAACLSQWWPATFAVDGVDYRSAEHWMMAAKARLFGDDAAAERILAAGHPGKAKAEGRKVRGFDEAVWQAQRYDLVVRGNAAKFGQNGRLGAYLRGTGDRVLVEASPVDRVWGIGLAPTDDHVEDPESWCGLNLLGFALMDARTLLTRQEPANDAASTSVLRWGTGDARG